MTKTTDQQAQPPETFFLAVACGLIVANLYYGQTLAGPITAALGMSAEKAGLVVTMSQLGYCLGLLVLAPMADVLENRRLAVTLTAACAIGLALQAYVEHSALFLGLTFLVGLSSVAVQVLVPLAAHLASEESRGRVVGKVMSGLMTGIMVARPLASGIAGQWSWRIVFAASSVMMILTAILLTRRLPERVPQSKQRLPELLKSMFRLLLQTPILQQRAFYQACLFGLFSMFWTAAPLYLSGPSYEMSQSRIALFSLAGLAGVIAAPLAGSLADAGRVRLVTLISMLVVGLSFAGTILGQSGSQLQLGFMVLAAIGIDFGVTACLVVGQREVFSLAAELRGRLNGMFIALFFIGGAVGSALGGWVFEQFGWHGIVGTALGSTVLVSAVFFVIESAKKANFR